MRGRAMSPSDLSTRARQLPRPTYFHMAMRLLPRPVVYLVYGLLEVDLLSSKMAITWCMGYFSGEAGMVTGGAAVPCTQASPMASFHTYISFGTYYNFPMTSLSADHLTFLTAPTSHH